MLYFYVTIHDENTEVMILDNDVLRTSLHLWENCKRDCYLIVFTKNYGCYWFFENSTQYRRSVSLKFEYKLNFLHKTHKI